MFAERTDADKRALLTEVMDPQKVQLYCALHNYFGPSTTVEMKPKQGCSRCWFVFFFHDIASTPPDRRAARLAELDEVLHKVVEEVERGKFDFEPYRHAKIEMESN
jgi:hypothetical protein